MTQPDDAALAEALRANLKKRKDRMRAAIGQGASVESFGADEEGDVPPSDRPGAWAHEGSKRV